MKKLHFLNIKSIELNREEMRHIIAAPYHLYTCIFQTVEYIIPAIKT